MVDTGIHKIHLFHTYDLHFYFSTNTKARWWILKSTKQVKCWIRCIYHCTKHQPQKRERGTVESHSVHFNKIKNDWSVLSLAYKYGLHYLHDIWLAVNFKTKFHSFYKSFYFLPFLPCLKTSSCFSLFPTLESQNPLSPTTHNNSKSASKTWLPEMVSK